MLVVVFKQSFRNRAPVYRIPVNGYIPRQYLANQFPAFSEICLDFLFNKFRKFIANLSNRRQVQEINLLKKAGGQQ